MSEISLHGFFRPPDHLELEREYQWEYDESGNKVFEIYKNEEEITCKTWTYTENGDILTEMEMDTNVKSLVLMGN